jgi:hypothetical protein
VLTRCLDQLVAQRTRAQRVKAKEVDRLTDLGVSVLPRLADLADDERGHPLAPIGDELGGPLQHARSLVERTSRPPRGQG